MHRQPGGRCQARRRHESAEVGRCVDLGRQGYRSHNTTVARSLPVRATLAAAKLARWEGAEPQMLQLRLVAARKSPRRMTGLRLLDRQSPARWKADLRGWRVCAQTGRATRREVDVRGLRPRAVDLQTKAASNAWLSQHWQKWAVTARSLVGYSDSS